MPGDLKTNEWNLLKDQFDALAYGAKACARTASKNSLTIKFVAASVSG